MPPDVPLDPCRQWLGIDAADLGDHHRVLGIAPDERDPLTVLRAAEARLNRLRGVSAGPLEFVRSGFVKRVEVARESVLAEIAAAGSKGSGPTFHRPPAPSTLASQPPVVRPATGGPPPVPRPAVPVPAVPVPPVVPAEAVGMPVPIAIRTSVYRKKTPVVGVAAALVGLSALAGGLGYYALVVKPKQVARVAHGARGGTADHADEDDEGTALEKGRDDASPAGSRGRSPPAPAVEEGDRPPPRARPRRRRSTPSETAQPAEKDASAASRAADDAMSKPEAPTEDRDSTRKDVGKPQPVPGMSEQAALEESGRLDQTLRDVRVSLRAGQDDAVERLLKTAAGTVRGTPARQRLAGWQRLVQTYGTFLEGRSAALKAVEPGARYQVAGKSVVIEKLDDRECVYRASGPPKTVALEKIPTGIVLAVVAGWFGDDPKGDLAIAAYHLVRDEPELRLARVHLDKAREAGADVETLLTLIDDPLFAREAGAGGDN